jgi:hypothetical protein
VAFVCFMVNISRVLHHDRAGRSEEGSSADYDCAVAFQLNDVNRAGVFRRAGIIGDDLSVANASGLVPVTKRDVVSAGCNDLIMVNEPGAHQPVRIPLIYIVTVRHCELPACRTRPRVGERRHVHVIGMRAPPDLELELGKSHAMIDVEPEDADVWDRRQTGPPVYGVRSQWIMIARKDDDRPVILAQDLCGTLEQFAWLPVIIKRIAGQDNHVRAEFVGRRQNSLEHTERSEAPFGVKAVIDSDMEIRTMDDNGFWVRSGAHNLKRMQRGIHQAIRTERKMQSPPIYANFES